MKTALTAYNTKTKQSGVPIQDAVLYKTKQGRWMAKGHDGKGNNLNALVSEATAQQAIADGTATLQVNEEPSVS